MPENHDEDQTRSFVALTNGTMVCHYKIISKIGAGGMGEVYLAEDTRLHRNVALKFLSEHLCRDELCRQRFQREAEASAKLDHPNIVAVHEIGKFRQRPYFVMPFAEGCSLQVLVGKGKLNVDEIISIGLQICSGLQSAHESGVIHRDIKPSNLIIDEAGHVRILDFGLAAIAEASQLTQTGTRMGTPRYMSPEQIQAQNVDKRSDIYALGLVLFELMSGVHPLAHYPIDSVSYAIVNEPIRFPNETVHPHIRELQSIVLKCLSKKPDSRYQSAAALATDIHTLTSEIPEISHATIRRFNLRRLVWALFGIALVISVSYFLVIQNDEVDKPLIIRYESAKSEQNRLAVMKFLHIGVEDEIKYTAAGFSFGIEEIAKWIFEHRLVPHQYLKGFDPTNYRLEDVREAVSCDYLLTGTIARLGAKYQISYLLLDTKDSSSMDRKTLPLASEEELPELEELIVRNVTSVLQPDKEAGRKQTALAIKLNQEGRRHFDRAIYFLDHGEHKLAYEEFNLAETASKQPDLLAYYKAKAIEGMGRFEEAISQYRKALPGATQTGMFETIWMKDSAYFHDLVQDTLAVYGEKVNDSTRRITLFNLAEEREVWQRDISFDSSHGTSAIIGDEAVAIHWYAGRNSFTEFLYLDLLNGKTKWIYTDSVTQNIFHKSSDPSVTFVGGKKRRYGSYNTWSSKYAVIDNTTGEILLRNIISPRYNTADVVLSRPDTAYATKGFYIINFRSGDTLLCSPAEANFSVDSEQFVIVSEDTSAVIAYKLADGIRLWSWSIPSSLRSDTLLDMWKQGDRVLLSFKNNIVCLDALNSGSGRVIWQNRPSPDSSTSIARFFEGYHNCAPADWIVEVRATRKEVEIFSLANRESLYKFDLGKHETNESYWPTHTEENTIYSSGEEWLVLMQPEDGTVELFMDFPIGARSWNIQRMLRLMDRYVLVLDSDGSLHIYRRGLETKKQIIRPRDAAQRIVGIAENTYLLGRTGITALHLNSLSTSEAIYRGDILARLAYCKLQVGETDSARVYNDYALDAMGAHSAAIAANRYEIMMREDSSCYIGDAFWDCWLVNQNYKAVRDSILSAMRDSLKIEWIVSGNRRFDSDPGFTNIDQRIEEFRSAYIESTTPEMIFTYFTSDYADYVGAISTNTGNILWTTKINLKFGASFSGASTLFYSDSSWLIVLGRADTVSVIDYRSGDIVYRWAQQLDTILYQTPNWGSHPASRLLCIGEEGIVIGAEHPIKDMDAFDIMIEKYSWDGHLMSREMVKNQVPTVIAKGSVIRQSDDYLLCHYSPYHDSRKEARRLSHFDSILVFSKDEQLFINAFDIEPGFNTSRIVGNHLVVVDASVIRGYLIPSGKEVFSIKHDAGGFIWTRIARITDSQFLLIDSNYVSSYWIDSESPGGIRRQFKTTSFKNEERVLYPYHAYVGQRDGKIYFAIDNALTCLSSTTGEIIYRRPILQGIMWWSDIGLHNEYVIVPAGEHLIKFSAENLCD